MPALSLSFKFIEYHVYVSDASESVASGYPNRLAGVIITPSLEVAALEEEEAVMVCGVLQPCLKTSETVNNMHVLFDH